MADVLANFLSSRSSGERRKELDRLIADGSAEALRALGEIFIHSANKEFARLAITTLLKMAAEGKSEAQDTLCRLVIDYDQAFVRELVLEAGYAPRDPQARALFYFLTEQWKHYDALDFEGKLLQSAFPGLNSEIYQRLNEVARHAGRLDFVTILTAHRHLKRTGELSGAEWQTTLELLQEKQAWEEMWRLAQFAPPIWSLALLIKLKEAEWKPKAESEQQWLYQLLERVERCSREPGELLEESVVCAATFSHSDGLSSVAISPDGELLAAGGFDATVYLRSLPDGKLRHALRNHSKWINCVGFSRDSRFLFSGAFGWERDKPLRVWELPNGRMLYAAGAPGSEIMSIAFHPDGGLLAFAGRRETKCIRFLSLHKQETPPEMDGLFPDITSLTFSPDGQYLFSGNADGIVRVWTVADWKPFAELEGHRESVDCIAVSPDSRMLASGGRDSTIRLWQIPEREPLAVLHGTASWVKSLAFSHDGSMLASGSYDNAIRIWSMPEGKLRQTISGHKGVVTGLAFSPEGDFLASSSVDRSVRLWDVWKFHTRRLLSETAQHCDINFISRVLEQHRCSLHERGWLEFIQTLLRWQQRFDLEIAEHSQTILVGEFDIELG